MKNPRTLDTDKLPQCVTDAACKAFTSLKEAHADELLYNTRDYDPDDDNSFRGYFSKVFEIMVRALEGLDKEGLFGTVTNAPK